MVVKVRIRVVKVRIMDKDRIRDRVCVRINGAD